MLCDILKTIFVFCVLVDYSSQLDIKLLEESEAKFDPLTLENVGKVYYYFGKDKVSWYEALSKCRSVGGFLASIDEPSKAKAVSDHLLNKHASNEVFWLSGADLHKQDDFYWYGTGAAFHYTDWYENQGENSLTGGNCVNLLYHYLGYQMNKSPCNTTSNYICEFEKPKTALKNALDDNTTLFEKVGEKFYHFGQSESSWYKAYLNCRAKGGHLASINGPSEMQSLSQYLTDKYPVLQYWWLSGADFYKYNKFDWYGTGQEFNYTNWSEYYHDNMGEIENCVHLWADGSEYKMEAFPCHKEAYFICEA